MTIIFVLAVASIPSFAAYAGGTVPMIALIALFVTLIPTTIGALLSAIGIAGMDRLVRFNVLAMSGRAVEAAGDVDTLLLDKTGTITLGNRQATEFVPLPGVSERDLADAVQLASLADETPEGRSIVVLAKTKYGIRGREMAPLHAHLVPFTAQTRMSGIDIDGHSIRKGAADAVVDYVRQISKNPDMPTPRSLQEIAERIARGGRHAARRRPRRQAAGRRPSQGHRQGRHPRAVRRTSADGHPHGDDHRRQPADGGRDRRRGGRRRLPRRSDAGGEAEAHPRRAGPRQARRHVRRRHQRRSGARPGRRRRRHEHRHDGGARGGQHGRSRQRSDQAHRDRRDRQATADDARRIDDVLDRQRRRQVLRDHPGDLHRLLPAARRAQRDAAGEPGERHPLGDHLQRADHRGADPARAARRPLSAEQRRRAAPAQSPAVRPGRHHRPVRRHQG